jgi:hypothetical protein
MAIDEGNAATVKRKDTVRVEWHNLRGKSTKGGRPFAGNRRRREGDAGKSGKIEKEMKGEWHLAKGTTKTMCSGMPSEICLKIYGKMGDNGIGGLDNFGAKKIWIMNKFGPFFGSFLIA